MDIAELQKHWDRFGQKDPFWAILTSASQRNNRWQQQEFFETGKAEIAKALDQLQTLGVQLTYGRCLDFGCGVGRLTQALQEHFAECDGVDIAPSMIEAAQRYNQYPETCRYHLNGVADLRLFADQSFDFIYSTLVLQHMQPEYSKSYIAEFMRILKPGGVAYFQAPSEVNTRIYDQALPESGYRAQITVATPLIVTAPGKQTTLQVTVKNIGDSVWEAANDVDVTCHFTLGNHWLDAQGAMVQYDDGRTPLRQRLAPGEQVQMELIITAPAQSGDYQVELDLVQEMICWFKDRGSQTTRVQVQSRLHPLKKIQQAIGALFARSKPAPEAPPVMEMHCIHRDEVVRLVEEHGGQVAHILNDTYCGKGWISYTYIATKNATT